MIELKIDSTKNELSLTHDVCCNEHLADELAIIIDIMIADYFIKNGHKYDNCSLEDILKDLGKWYDFDVRYVREDARLIPFSLNIKKHDAFAEVLQLLEDTGCVKFEIRDNVVVVK